MSENAVDEIFGSVGSLFASLDAKVTPKMPDASDGHRWEYTKNESIVRKCKDCGREEWNHWEKDAPFTQLPF